MAKQSQPPKEVLKTSPSSEAQRRGEKQSTGDFFGGQRASQSQVRQANTAERGQHDHCAGGEVPGVAQHLFRFVSAWREPDK